MDSIERIVEQTSKLGHTLAVLSDIKSGKEAMVYRVLLDGDLVAMKVYKKPEERDFKNTATYLEGKYYRRPSERKAAAKGGAFVRRLRHENWVTREFFILKKLFDSGASIPRPIFQIDDALFMELLGGRDTVAARLCDVDLDADEAKKVFDQIIRNVEIFWNEGIVHADLSAFNILWWNSLPYIIDFPQSVDRRTHPSAKELLYRDLGNVAQYFGKYHVNIDLNEIKDTFRE